MVWAGMGLYPISSTAPYTGFTDPAYGRHRAHGLHLPGWQPPHYR